MIQNKWLARARVLSSWLTMATVLSISHPALSADPGNNTGSKNTQKSGHVHGIGKQDFDCDFSTLAILTPEKTAIRKVNELVRFDARDYANHTARRLIKQGFKVYPLAMLLEEQKDAWQLLIESCDASERLIIDTKTIRDDPKRFLLTMSRKNRPRLVEFIADEGRRARYVTAVRNVSTISIH